MVDEPTNDMTDLAEIVQPVAAAMAPTAEEFDQSLKEASLKAKSLTQIIKDNTLLQSRQRVYINFHSHPTWNPNIS